jgi:hypothetical protein
MADILLLIGIIPALKTVVEASGDTLDEWLHTSVIQAIESDVDLYFRQE